MYEKPQVERLGTFRELTQLGLDQGNDLFSGFGIPGCSEGAENEIERCDRS